MIAKEGLFPQNCMGFASTGVHHPCFTSIVLSVT